MRHERWADEVAESWGELEERTYAELVEAEVQAEIDRVVAARAKYGPRLSTLDLLDGLGA